MCPPCRVSSAYAQHRGGRAWCVTRSGERRARPVARHRDDLEEALGVIASPPPPRPVKRRTVRGRLIRLIALPVVAVFVLLTIVVVSYTGGYQTADHTNHAVRLLIESD